ncbi:MAG: dodecin [Acidimicrobiales bacterium]
MSNPTYSVTEVVGTSDVGISEAIANGVETAARTLRNLDWFEVVAVRGAIADGKVSQYQATIKLGFRYES